VTAGASGGRTVAYADVRDTLSDGTRRIACGRIDAAPLVQFEGKTPVRRSQEKSRRARTGGIGSRNGGDIRSAGIARGSSATATGRGFAAKRPDAKTAIARAARAAALQEKHPGASRADASSHAARAAADRYPSHSCGACDPRAATCTRRPLQVYRGGYPTMPRCYLTAQITYSLCHSA